MENMEGLPPPKEKKGRVKQFLGGLRRATSRQYLRPGMLTEPYIEAKFGINRDIDVITRHANGDHSPSDTDPTKE